MVKTENETENVPQRSNSDTDTKSFLTINDDKGRIYQCVANNSVGIGSPCHIEITGKTYVDNIWQKMQCCSALAKFEFSNILVQSTYICIFLKPLTQCCFFLHTNRTLCTHTTLFLCLYLKKKKNKIHEQTQMHQTLINSITCAILRH